MRSAVAGVVAVVVLASAAAAQGAQRYAAPTGTGTSCTQAVPCELKEAISKAAKNDEVIVTAGTYAVVSTIASFAENLHVHGDFTGPMPRINGTVGGVPISLIGYGTRLEFLDISNVATSAYAANCTTGGRINRIRAVASGTTSATGVIQTSTCVVQDSVIKAVGPKAVAISGSGPIGSSTGLVRNVTAIAEGSGSTGILSYYSTPLDGDYTLDLKNVIAAGTASDLKAMAGSFGPGKIVVTNSNFDVASEGIEATITGSDNQTAPPIFVDAAAGDYRQAAGSPTIDAGSTDQIGALDFDGNPRMVGAAPDIGAFEFVPPAAPAASIESLTFSAKSFRAGNVGGAIVSRTRKPKAPVGTTVTYKLSTAGTVAFSVERAVKGRKVGKKCKKAARANRSHKRCTFFKARKGSFTHNGTGGQNSFKFSGRINGKALAPGRYRLVGTVGDSIKRAAFKIVR